MAIITDSQATELKARGWTDQMIGWLVSIPTAELDDRIADIDEWLGGNFNPAQMDAIKSSTSFANAASFIRTQLPPGASINPRRDVPVTRPGERTYDEPNTSTTAASEASARAEITSTLEAYGLGSLADWAWEQHKAGVPNSQIFLDMRSRPEYQARFPAMKTLGQQGRAISEAAYIDYERSAASLMRSYGLPSGFFDQPSDFTAFLTGGVALPELKSRLDDYQTAVYQSPVEVRNALRDFYNLNEGQILAAFIDPDRALPLIHKQLNAAQAAGTSARTGFATLSREQAEGLASLGLDPSVYQAGFSRLASQGEILQGLPGQNQSPISTDTALAAQFGGNVAAQQEIENRALDILAPNKQGGQVATTQRGAVGAGVAR